ncbi:MAG TPA: dihydrofolate reductase family protein [Candidatus Saccharibacteria bacterium]|nr:dihydrofolate reductase family protein [Candidatus Saccharibacteria bacterium]
MTRIIIDNRMTVDGMFAGPNGELDWFMPDIELDSYVFGPSGKEQPTTILFGRTTYDMFRDYWPQVHSGEMQLDFLPSDSLRQHERDIAALLTNLRKVVVTSKDDDLGWHNTEKIDGELVAAAQKLKETSDGDIIIFGSGSVIAALEKAGLVDDYWLQVTPVVIGSGKSMFASDMQQNLALIESKVSGQGGVLLHYQPKVV